MSSNLIMKQISFLLTVFFCCLSTVLQAQNQNYKQAYIINSEGDTLRGTVHVPKNQSHYLRVNFFLKGDFSKAKQYNPRQISEYGYEQDNVFRSFTFTDQLEFTDKSSVFLKVLVDNNGTYSLLVFRDAANTPTYFIEDEKAVLIQLSKEKLTEQLHDLSKNCNQNEVNEMVTSVRYGTASLSRFINAYNSCQDSNYVADELYLSEGIRNFGLKLGTGFGPALLKQYPFDSPDLTVAFRMDYSLNKNNSVMLEAGFSKRSLTYTYDQMGSVSVYSIPKASTFGEVKSTSIVDANLIYASVTWKKNLDKMYYGFSGGMGVKLSSSEIMYAAELKDEDFKNQLEWDIYIEDEYKIVNLIPSLHLIAGIPINLSSIEGNLEFSIGYLNIKADNEEWTYSEVPSKVTIMESKNFPYIEYTVDKPRMPKLVFDISLIIPVFR